MIITKSTPYTDEEIKDLQEVFETYIKTVIDIKKEFVQPIVTGIMSLKKDC